MGVYIKGIEMPKESRLTLQISADGAVYVVNSCSITAETYTTDAVPVPPHGRLIDADALFGLLDKCMFPSDMVTTSAVRMATNWIKDAPTIIEAEKEET